MQAKYVFAKEVFSQVDTYQPFGERVTLSESR
jgi:hypothetical protein